MDQLFNFNRPTVDLIYFNNLPNDLHIHIYGFVYDEVINSAFYHYDWYMILDYIGHHLFYENLIKTVNNILPTTNQFQITEHDMYDVGFYEEKVTPSIFQRRYIWCEDGVDSEKLVSLILDNVNNYIISCEYTSQGLFNINKELSSMFKKTIEYEEYPETDDYYIDLSNEMNTLINSHKPCL